MYKSAGGKLVAQTLEKYQEIFTHDLHLLDSCCDEGHLAHLEVPLLTYTFDKHELMTN